MAHRLLFPLATLYALIAVPLWLVLQNRHPAMIGATCGKQDRMITNRLVFRRLTSWFAAAGWRLSGEPLANREPASASTARYDALVMVSIISSSASFKVVYRDRVLAIMPWATLRP
jgi:hypothetical protein